MSLPSHLRRADVVLSIVLVLVLLLRLITLGAYPLFDLTEARYADIAREMVQRADWITLWYPNNQPFWAKPPLSTWLSAAGIWAFGINEFAVRLPMWLVSLGVVAVVWRFGRSQRGSVFGLRAALVLAAMPGFWICSGAVMTDIPLLLAVVFAQYAGWQALNSPLAQRAAWTYGLFTALGAGLLSKGPLAIVLVVPAIFVWALVTRRLRELFALPWLRGTVLMLLIAAPWYVLADLRTPGFLNYFLLGEYVMRFLHPGWKGDLYGSAHIQPFGAIWLYLLLVSLPWCIAAVFRLLRAGVLRSYLRSWRDDPWLLYLLLSAAAPMLLFSALRNLLWTYTLPALPPLALLITEAWRRAAEAAPRPLATKWLPAAALGVAAALSAAIFLIIPQLDLRSAKPLLQALDAAYPGPRPKLLVASGVIYSSRFYTDGAAIETSAEQAIEELNAAPLRTCVTLDERTLAPLRRSLTVPIEQVARSRQYLLLCSKRPAAAP